MTPKEKAKDLANSFFEVNRLKGDNKATNPFISRDYSKQCALICVDEILKEVPETEPMETYLSNGSTTVDYFINERYKYWQEVKKEIENL